jgi:hypothetical protein
VITSAEARAAAHAFLADAAPTCPSAWDGELGRVAGGVIEWGQGRISDAYVAAEERVAAGALALVGVPPRYGRLVYRVAAGTARVLRSTP